jgi:hypothetical protein
MGEGCTFLHQCVECNLNHAWAAVHQH